MVLSKRKAFTAFALSAALLVAACSKNPTDPAASVPTELLTVSPEGGATGVFVGTPVILTFDHPLMDGMEDYMDVHEGDVTGPKVAGTCVLSEGGDTLTFTPDQELKPATTYVIHVGGGMMDVEGDSVDLGGYGMGMGGEWVTETMMGDSTSMGGMMGGGTGPAGHMGDGWWDDNNSTWGMAFSFTTAGSPQPVLVMISPRGGETGVDPSEPIVLTFDRPMQDHATDYADIHEGNVNGTVVAGSWSRSTDSLRFTFTPDTILKPATDYTVHLGGGMLGADSARADFDAHGVELGGKWADSTMMGGGMQGGTDGHMGDGWQDAHGSYGMVFTFTTAGTHRAALVAIESLGGATDVDPTAPLVATFDHAVGATMTAYAALHEGDVNGPEVPGTWSLSQDSTQLIFVQDEPLKAASEYTIHLGSGMTDSSGSYVDLESNGTQLGGEWVTDSMIGGSMGGGMNGGGHPHTGEGWDYPDNGSHGMIFTFTTAS